MEGDVILRCCCCFFFVGGGVLRPFDLGYAMPGIISSLLPFYFI